MSDTLDRDDPTALLTNNKVAHLPTPAQLHSDRYVLGEQIGAGAAGVVYAAYDVELARQVAIKMVAPAKKREHLLRFRREAQAIAQLSHPNVVTIHDVGSIAGEAYVAMEFVKGQSLLEWMRCDHALAQILQVFVQAAHGLNAAHHEGIVHRDFKPANVLVGDDGRVRVADFGLARFFASADSAETVRPRVGLLGLGMTGTGSTVGTPRYMAPEQFAGDTVDARADQFAFCVSLYEALSKQRPFVGRDYESLAENVMNGRCHPLEAAAIPAWLRAVVMRGLQLRPGDRFASMDELIAELTADRGAQRRMAVDTASTIEPMFAAFPPQASVASTTLLAALRGDLETARQLKSRGKYDEAIAIVSTVVRRCEDVDYLPLRAAALYTLGNLQQRTGACAAACETLYDAASVAARAGDDWQLANVWVCLVTVLAELKRFDRARTIGRVADVAILRLGGNASLRSRLCNNLGRSLLAAGHHDQALEYFHRSLKLDEQTHGANHPFLVIALVSLAESLLELGHHELAASHAQRAVAIHSGRDAVLDNRPRPSHASALHVLGRVLVVQGDVASARTCFEKAKLIWEQCSDRADELAQTIAALASC